MCSLRNCRAGGDTKTNKILFSIQPKSDERIQRYLGPLLPQEYERVRLTIEDENVKCKLNYS